MDDLISTFIIKHHEIDNFFRIYNLQMRKMESGEPEPKSGPISVIKQIYRYSLMNLNNIPEICDLIIISEKDPFIHEFFSKLKIQSEAL